MKITSEKIERFRTYLTEAERSENTISKYVRDVGKLQKYAQQQDLSKTLMIEYKSYLTQSFKPASVNSMLAAANNFLDFLGLGSFKVKPLKMQKRVYFPEEKELKMSEYKRLINAADKNERLKLILETIASTGIRISELRFITAEAVRRGAAEVNCKGKYRMVFLPKKLCEILKKYTAEQKITAGAVFVTRSGNPVDHSNISREMKKLAGKSNVDKKKVYPHNFRHFFARTFYSKTKDLSRLADILGHSNVNTTRIYTAESGRIHMKMLDSLELTVPYN